MFTGYTREEYANMGKRFLLAHNIGIFVKSGVREPACTYLVS